MAGFAHFGKWELLNSYSPVGQAGEKNGEGEKAEEEDEEGKTEEELLSVQGTACPRIFIFIVYTLFLGRTVYWLKLYRNTEKKREEVKYLYQRIV